MKKILLGLLILGVFSACSSSEKKEKKITIPMQISSLNEAVDINAKLLTDIRFANEDIRFELEDSKKQFIRMAEYIDMVRRFKNLGITTVTTDNGLHLILPKETSFQSSKAILNENMKIVLDIILNDLVNYPDVEILIQGNSDATGRDKFNKNLSEDRAIAVSKYLINRGMDSSKIKAVGVGSSNPIDNNKTKDGRKANRRIDLIIDNIDK